MRIQRSLSGRLGLRQAEGSSCAFLPARQGGFSLIEMMVVIAIMAIMMAIALPAFSEWRESAAAKTAADTLVAHLKQARIKAIAESRCVSVLLNTASPSYTVDSLSVPLSQYSQQLTMTTTIAATTKAFIFRSDGSSGTNTCGSFNTASGSVTISSPAAPSHKITMNSVGRVYLK